MCINQQFIGALPEFFNDKFIDSFSLEIMIDFLGFQMCQSKIHIVQQEVAL